MKEKSTKDKILTAARTLFTANGFAGTSIGNIAKLAEVNHSLVFHHFKNKEQLWIAVKQDIVREANAQTEIFPDTNLPFAIFLKKLFVRKMNFYRESPDIIRMLNWQRLEKDTGYTIGVTHSDDMKKWSEVFKHYQLQGDILSNLKPEWIVTMVLSIISSAALDPIIFINDEENLNQYIDFCVDALLKAFS